MKKKQVGELSGLFKKKTKRKRKTDYYSINESWTSTPSVPGRLHVWTWISGIYTKNWDLVPGMSHVRCECSLNLVAGTMGCWTRAPLPPTPGTRRPFSEGTRLHLSMFVLTTWDLVLREDHVRFICSSGQKGTTFLLVFEIGPRKSQLSWTSLCKPGLLPIQRPTCLWLLNAGIKGACYLM